MTLGENVELLEAMRNAACEITSGAHCGSGRLPITEGWPDQTSVARRCISGSSMNPPW